MSPSLRPYLGVAECVIERLPFVQRAQVQQVPGRMSVSVDVTVNKPMTLGIIAEILEQLNDMFGGQQLPNIELGPDTIFISDLKYKPRTRVESYVSYHTYS